jgi:hypothetical protein
VHSLRHIVVLRHHNKSAPDFEREKLFSAQCAVLMLQACNHGIA